MLKIYDYACLAGHVYAANTQRQYYGLQFQFKDASQFKYGNVHLKPLQWLVIEKLTPWLDSAHPFFARLYIKMKSGRAVSAVIAYRGTELFQYQNDRSDMRIWETDLPYGYGNAIAYYNAAQDFVDTHFNGLPLRCTGHSLGGALAQLAGVHKIARAVAFNSPGVGLLPGVKGALNDAYYKKLILNINARGGRINKVGRLIGDEIKVDIPPAKGLDAWVAPPEFIREHFIANLIKAVMQDDRLGNVAC